MACSTRCPLGKQVCQLNIAKRIPRTFARPAVFGRRSRSINVLPCLWHTNLFICVTFLSSLLNTGDIIVKTHFCLGRLTMDFCSSQVRHENPGTFQYSSPVNADIFHSNCLDHNIPQAIKHSYKWLFPNSKTSTSN